MTRLRTLLPTLAISLSLAGALTPASAQVAGTSFKDCETCPDMMTLPSGSAVHGSEPWSADRKLRDAPIHDVTIEYTFAVSKHETTVAQFRTFVEATGYETAYEPQPGRLGCNSWDYNRLIGFARDHTWESPGFDQNDSHPAVCLSWADAAAYAAWLADATGKPYRLLSSTEFEYATRAGTRGPWFWGNSNVDACTYANVADATFRRLFAFAPVFACDDGYERTSPVGIYEPNPWGLYDMLGNAWEWTDDCAHDDMSKVPTDGRAWKEEDGGNCDRRTPRGGSYLSGTDWVRAAAQAGDGALYHSQLLGFRVALTLDE